MYTADPDRGVDREEIGLREEDLAGVDAELANLDLGELHLFAPFPFQEAPDYIIQHTHIHHALHCHHFIFLSLEFNQIAVEQTGMSSARSNDQFLWVEREMRDDDDDDSINDYEAK